MGDPIRVQRKFMAQRCDGLVFVQCGKRHAGLELGSLDATHLARQSGLLFQFQSENSNTPDYSKSLGFPLTPLIKFVGPLLFGLG